jgi:hypothetical protein
MSTDNPNPEIEPELLVSHQEAVKIGGYFAFREALE